MLFFSFDIAKLRIVFDNNKYFLHIFLKQPHYLTLIKNILDISLERCIPFASAFFLHVFGEVGEAHVALA